MALNVFKYCTGLKVIGSFMILVVLGVVSVTYYAIVICTYGPDLFAGGAASFVSFLVLTLFHALLAMLLWCYFATVITDPGSVPDDWNPFSTPFQRMEEIDLEAQAQSGRSSDDATSSLVQSEHSSAGSRKEGEMSETGKAEVRRKEASDSVEDDVEMRAPLASANQSSEIAVRRCKKCLQYKPPRAHHCSVCGRCILKMDHHCVWVVNCIGAKNYKSFLLFMAYTFLETFLVSASLLPWFIAFFAKDIQGDATEPGKLAAVFLSFVLNLAFTVSLLGFIAMHSSLLLSNSTTIEAFEKSKAGKYDLGKRRNFEQVFGRKPWYWPLPVYSAEDLRTMPELSGLYYPSKPASSMHSPSFQPIECC